MVAAVCTWHERHSVTAAAIERRLQRGERLVIAAHALLEAYAVLTRLPAPHRLAPSDAWALVKTNFVERATVVALSGPAYLTLLNRLVPMGIGGGRSYDAIIAACARQGKVDALLTLNARHFDGMPDGVPALEP